MSKSDPEFCDPCLDANCDNCEGCHCPMCPGVIRAHVYGNLPPVRRKIRNVIDPKGRV